MLARTAFIAALAGLWLAPAAAQTGLQPSSAPEIAAAAKSCLNAVTTSAVDESRLLADGWLHAPVTKDGKPVETPIRVYGQHTGNVLISTMPPSGGQGGTCILMAKTQQLSDYAAVAEALTSGLGAKPVQTKALETIWLVENKVIQLVATGTASAPSVRVGVVQVQGEKK